MVISNRVERKIKIKRLEMNNIIIKRHRNYEDLLMILYPNFQNLFEAF